MYKLHIVTNLCIAVPEGAVVGVAQLSDKRKNSNLDRDMYNKLKDQIGSIMKNHVRREPKP